LNAWVNGRPGTRLDIRDRGLQYGDGVFETMRIRAGRVRFSEYHLERLTLGCRRLGIAEPSSRVLRREIAAAALRRREGVLKLILTRGPGPRGY
jgi:4-amino-4-deoxychorismate lyase